VKVVKQDVKKGSKLYIEGALQTRKWQDQSGADRSSTEVVLLGFGSNLTMLDSRGGGGGSSDHAPANDTYGGNASYGAASGGQSSSGRSEAFAPADDIDDEIPF